MPRPRKIRRIRSAPCVGLFKPQGVPMSRLIGLPLPLEGLEAMRLCDMEGLAQEEAAERMGVSRATLQRMLAGARKTVATALVEGKALRIEVPKTSEEALDTKDAPTDKTDSCCRRLHGGGRRSR